MTLNRGRLLGCLIGLALIVGAGSHVSADERLELAEEAYGSGDFAAAYKLAGKVLKKQPDNALAHYIAGAAGMMLDEAKVGKEEAEDHLERALELEPRSPVAHYLLGYSLYQRARALDEGDETEMTGAMYARSAEHFEAELAISPGYTKAIEGLARALAGVPEPDRAIDAHEAWIAASPEAVSAYASLAGVLVASGRFNEAVAQLDRLPPGSYDTELSMSFEMAREMYLGENKNAASQAIRALAARISQDWYRHALRFLEQLGNEELAEATEELMLFVDRHPPVAAKRALTDIFIENTPVPTLEEAVRMSREAELSPYDGSHPERIAESYRQPIYPDVARKAKIESRVKALTVIRRDGTVVVIFVSSNRPGLGFEESATRAIEQWRYRPALKDGEPVNVVTSVIIDFTLM
jgi:TonB family protein